MMLIVDYHMQLLPAATFRQPASLLVGGSDDRLLIIDRRCKLACLLGEVALLSQKVFFI